MPAKNLNSEDSNQTESLKQQHCIAIVQLTRFGDLIQTAQAAASLKEIDEDKRPKLILIARKQFALPLMFLLESVFDEIHFLDFEYLFSDVKQGLCGSHKKLKELTGLLNTKKIDVLINLSFSKTSNYLSSIINSTFKLGASYNAHNKIEIPDTWSKYIYSNVMGGPLNSFNLVDIFSSILGSSNEGLSPAIIKKKTNKIILHPFASQDKKRWKPNKWVEVVFKVLKDNPEINLFIVGSKKELEQARSICEHQTLSFFADRLHNLAGKTNLQELYGHLSEAQLFVGHDSMVSHLASVTQTQSVTISLGTVRAQETMAYLDGNYSIAPKTNCFPCFPDDKCESYKCHSDIPYQVVSSSINQLIQTGEITRDSLVQSTSEFHLSNSRVYKYEYQNSKFIRATDVSSGTQSKDDVFRSLLRIAWLYSLTEKEEQVEFPKISPETVTYLLSFQEGVKNLFELAEFGKKYSKYILEEISSDTPNVTSIKKYSQNIDEIGHLQNIVKQNYQELSPFIDYHSISKANLKGSNLVELTESSYICFEELSGLCSVLYELIDKSVADYNKNRAARLLQNTRK